MQRNSDVVPHPRATTTNFSRFPVELHYHILGFADLEDILTLRKTCKYFLALTQDPRLWTTVYDRMRNTHPLSCSRSEFAALTVRQSERLLVRASKTEKLLKTFRDDIQHRIIPDGQMRKIGRLRVLSFLSERFILSMDYTTVVCIWDIWEFASSRAAGLPSFPCASLTLAGWSFDTYSMSINDSTLYVVVSKGGTTHIFSLCLPSMDASDTDETELSFRDVAHVDTHFKRVYSIDPDSCLILLRLSDTVIEVVDWHTQSRSSIALDEERIPGSQIPDNYVLDPRICGPYILCFRYRSIEAYPIPLQFLKPELATEQPLPFLYLCEELYIVEDAVCMYLSDVRYNRSPSGDVYSIGVLGEVDLSYRTFNYLVHLQITPEPSLSLRLLGVHDELEYTDFQEISVRAFGTTGFRGVWVLKPDRSGDSYIMAFTTHPSQRPFDPNGVQEEEDPPPFDTEVVSVVRPQNSDDDVTICAVSEFTGRIALGSRTGAITLL